MGERILVLILFAYLIGSIPFSQLVTTWRTGLNLREVGEGNVGSRNVWHVVGPGWGLIAAFLDCFKGYFVYKVASDYVPLIGVLLAGIAVVLGHQFPIFLRGRGGKGLATALGVLLAISPYSCLAALVVLLLGSLVFRDFNNGLIAGVIAMILLPLVFREPPWVTLYALCLALLAGLKKVLDMAHESRVWREHPWQDGTATPGWQEGGNDHSPASSEGGRPR
jgi:glycerol-3-phosphate acyltransferase PlsY